MKSKLKTIIISTWFLSSTWSNGYMPSSEDSIDNSTSSARDHKSVNTKWATSNYGLKYLAEDEMNLYPVMKQFKAELASTLVQVKSWVDDYKESSGQGTLHLTNRAEIIQEISSHPLMALRMIRRFVKVKKLLIENMSEKLAIRHLSDLKTSNLLPNISDYEDSMEIIIRLRFIYDLDITDLINGNIFKVQTKVGLSEFQAYEIGLQAGKNSQFTEALFWIQTLVERNRKDEPKLDLNLLQSDILRISQEHDDHLYETWWDNVYRFTSKILSNNKTTLTTLKDFSLSNPQQYSASDLFEYYELCRSSGFVSEARKSKLVCFYETKIHPAWLIGPLKIEVHSWDPYVIRIYDAITEAEIEHLRNGSKSSGMFAAQVLNMNHNTSDPNSVDKFFDKMRVASFSIPDTNTEIMARLESKIGQMVGLEVDSRNYPAWAAEGLQIISYSSGGHYDFHHDAGLPADQIQPLEGDRIATFMIYLNDVKLGGQTGFPYIGVAVQPIRKSAIFWYNLFKNGNVDARTMHGGCPVIFGTKLISNTWIRSFGSFQKRKCSLNPAE